MPTTRELAALLLEAAPEHDGWSIVESPTAQVDLEVLLSWVRDEMTPQQWRSDLLLRRRELGLVLLWLECEVVRRLAGGGEVWPVLADPAIVPWNDDVRDWLFYQNVSTDAHRRLLRETAEHYRLRHTFGDEDAHNWFRLLTLQIGFTRNNAVHHLTDWLTGHPAPISVQRLLAGTDSGARSFQFLWQSLRAFRCNGISGNTLRARLRESPWVLPDWTDDVIAAARNGPDLGAEPGDLEATEIPFFTTPVLTLADGNAPRFETRLCNLNEFGLTGDLYDLVVDGTAVATLIRQEDGSFHPVGAQGDAIFLPPKPRLVLSLRGTDGMCAVQQAAVLWDTMEEVTMYSPRTGRMIAPGNSLRMGVAVWLIASADITFRTGHDVIGDAVALHAGYQLCRVNGQWVGRIEACLDDDVVWTSASEGDHAGGDLPVVRARFLNTLNVDELTPWALQLNLDVSPGWHICRLRWKRWNNELVEFNENVPEILLLEEQDALRPLFLRVRVRRGEHGEIRSVTVRVPVHIVAAVKWNADGTSSFHSPDGEMSLGEARRHVWSFSLPLLEDGQPRDPRLCCFTEGKTVRTRVKARPSALPELAGYGAPLSIVDDPYQVEAPVMAVSRCVIDGGVFCHVDHDVATGNVRIDSSFVAIGSEHQFLAWTSPAAGGPSGISVIPEDQLHGDDQGWTWNSGNGVTLHGIALFYRGHRIGSWLRPEGFMNAVEAADDEPRKIAVILRCWKAPLLRVDHRILARCIQWIHNNWSTVLPVWLKPAGTLIEAPSGFRWPAPDAEHGWLGVVGELLTAAAPAPCAHSAGELVDGIAPGQVGLQAVGRTVLDTADACPLLAVRVAQICADQLLTNAERATFFELMNGSHPVGDDVAERIGRIHGNRDGFWLSGTVLPLANVVQLGPVALGHPYRVLIKSAAYRKYVLGRWLREIQ